MNMYLFFRSRRVGVVCALLLAFATTNVFALENAYRWNSNSNTGVIAVIETGNPTLRNNASGKWSYMRPFSQNVSGGNVYYVEIGHYKDDAGHKVYYTYRTSSGSTGGGFVSGATPGVGVSYNYKVEHGGSNIWNLYFNELTGYDVSVNLGWSTGTSWASGGEVPDTSQGMGSSNNVNVAYRNSSTGTYSAGCPTNTKITNALYSIDNGSNCQSWRVYGNN